MDIWVGNVLVKDAHYEWEKGEDGHWHLVIKGKGELTNPRKRGVLKGIKPYKKEEKDGSKENGQDTGQNT